MVYKFKVKLLKPERVNSVYFEVPVDVPKEFGTRGRVKVKCTINGFEFRTSIAPMGGCFLIGLNKDVRVGTGTKAGDTVGVIMEKDEEERVVVVPEDLMKELKRNKVEKIFKEMAYTHKKEYVKWVEEAKKAETRFKRISGVIEKLFKK